ncbi:MAG: hypothetical protein ACF8XB_12940, partial [Planctomycetota bacterium JB042]
MSAPSTSYPLPLLFRELLALVTDAPLPPSFDAFANGLADFPSPIEVSPLRPHPRGHRVRVSVLALAGHEFAFPGIEAFKVRLGSPDGDALTLVVGEEPRPFLGIERVVVELIWENGWLRAEGEESDRTIFRFEGGASLDADLRLALADETGFSLPPHELLGTGITLALEDVWFQFGGGPVHPRVAEFGFAQPFRGLIARRFRVHVLPFLRFGARSGLTVEGRDVAIGDNGVTMSLFQAFDVDLSDRTGPMWGSLGEGGFSVAIEHVELDLFESEFRSFLATGALHWPAFDASLSASIGIRRLPGDRWSHSASLRARNLLELEVAGARVAVEELRLRGDLSAEETSLEGSAEGFTFEVGALALSAASIEASARFDAARTRLSLEVESLDVGPFGTVEE